MGRRTRKRLTDAPTDADRDFLRYVREADIDALMRMQKLQSIPLWRKIAIDRAVMRHVFGA